MELSQDLHVSLVPEHGVGHDHETGTAALQTLPGYPVYQGSSCLPKPCVQREKEIGRGVLMVVQFNHI